MVFPKSNLSTASQPWGRFVEKSITGLETVVATDRVNNAARDAQAALNIKRLDASLAQVANLGLQTAQNVADIQTITDSVFSLNTDVNSLESNVYAAGTTQINGFNIKAGTINANAINAGTLTGFTIQTADTGTRVVMGGSTIDVWYGSTKVGVLSGTAVYGSEVSLLSPGTYYGYYVTPNSVYMRGPSNYVSMNSSGTVTINGSGTSLTVGGGITLGANTDLLGDLWVSGSSVSFPNITTSTAAANTRWGTTTGGRMFYISSARKAKYDIQDANVNLEALNLRPRTWYDMNEYLENNNSTDGLVRIPGFVAEEVLEAGLEEFVVYDTKGEVQGLSYDRMVAAVIPVIKYLNEQVEELKSEINLLKGA